MKIILLLLAAGLAGAVFVSAAPHTITIGLVAKFRGNPVFQAARVGAIDAAKELSAQRGLNIKIDWRTPNEEDAQKQAEASGQRADSRHLGERGGLRQEMGEMAAPINRSACSPT
jgi:ribose transport system substrate-binding protein